MFHPYYPALSLIIISLVVSILFCFISCDVEEIFVFLLLSAAYSIVLFTSCHAYLSAFEFMMLCMRLVCPSICLIFTCLVILIFKNVQFYLDHKSEINLSFVESMIFISIPLTFYVGYTVSYLLKLFFFHADNFWQAAHCVVEPIHVFNSYFLELTGVIAVSKGYFVYHYPFFIINLFCFLVIIIVSGSTLLYLKKRVARKKKIKTQ